MKSQRSKRKKNMSLEGMGVVRERGAGGAGGGGADCNLRERRQDNKSRKHHVIQHQ